LFFSDVKLSGLRMRKVDAAAVAAARKAVPALERQEATVQLICLALTLATIALAARIFSVW
jgi:hypothetical protein